MNNFSSYQGLPNLSYIVADDLDIANLEVDTISVNTQLKTNSIEPRINNSPVILYSAQTSTCSIGNSSNSNPILFNQNIESDNITANTQLNTNNIQPLTNNSNITIGTGTNTGIIDIQQDVDINGDLEADNITSNTSFKTNSIEPSINANAVILYSLSTGTISFGNILNSNALTFNQDILVNNAKVLRLTTLSGANSTTTFDLGITGDTGLINCYRTINVLGGKNLNLNDASSGLYCSNLISWNGSSNINFANHLVGASNCSIFLNANSPIYTVFVRPTNNTPTLSVQLYDTTTTGNCSFFTSATTGNLNIMTNAGTTGNINIGRVAQSGVINSNIDLVFSSTKRIRCNRIASSLNALSDDLNLGYTDPSYTGLILINQNATVDSGRTFRVNTIQGTSNTSSASLYSLTTTGNINFLTGSTSGSLNILNGTTTGACNIGSNLFVGTNAVQKGIVCAFYQAYDPANLVRLFVSTTTGSIRLGEFQTSGNIILGHTTPASDLGTLNINKNTVIATGKSLSLSSTSTLNVNNIEPAVVGNDVNLFQTATNRINIGNFSSIQPLNIDMNTYISTGKSFNLFSTSTIYFNNLESQVIIDPVVLYGSLTGTISLGNTASVNPLTIKNNTILDTGKNLTLSTTGILRTNDIRGVNTGDDLYIGQNSLNKIYIGNPSGVFLTHSIEIQNTLRTTKGIFNGSGFAIYTDFLVCPSYDSGWIGGAGNVDFVNDVKTGNLNLATGITTGNINLATGFASTCQINLGRIGQTGRVQVNTNMTLGVAGTPKTLTCNTISTLQAGDSSSLFSNQTTGNCSIYTGQTSGVLSLGTTNASATLLLNPPSITCNSLLISPTVALTNLIGTTTATNISLGISTSDSGVINSVRDIKLLGTKGVFSDKIVSNTGSGATVNLYNDLTTGTINMGTAITTGNLVLGGAGTSGRVVIGNQSATPSAGNGHITAYNKIHNSFSGGGIYTNINSGTNLFTANTSGALAGRQLSTTMFGGAPTENWACIESNAANEGCAIIMNGTCHMIINPGDSNPLFWVDEDSMTTANNYAYTGWYITTGGVLTAVSDRRTKRDIQLVIKPDILNILSNINVVNYKKKAPSEDKYYKDGVFRNKYKEVHIGVVAQDVRQAGLPEVVVRENDDAFWTVKAQDLNYYHLMGTQELIKENIKLKEENQLLKERMDKIENFLKSKFNDYL